MESLVQASLVLLALGAGINAGLFFTFSTFVMPALARLPAPEGIRAMQAINVTVMNPLTMGVFLGTALASVVTIGAGALAIDARGSVLAIAAGACFVLGVFGVTAAGNVPLNDRLARVDADMPESARAWADYQRVWNAWNHVRTIAACLASVGFIAGAAW
jgi:uncharacterized membrane protein